MFTSNLCVKEAVGSSTGIAQPRAVVVTTEVSHGLADVRRLRVLLAWIGECANHLVDLVGGHVQQAAHLVEVCPTSRIVVPIAGSERGVQLRRGILDRLTLRFPR